MLTRRAPPHQSGFTLIEVMVVLVIMGVLVSFAVLSIGNSGQTDRLTEQSRRLEAKIRLSAEDAVLEGRDLGLGFFRMGYSFYELQGEDKWAEITNDPLIGPTRLEEDISLQLILEDTPIVMSGAKPEKPQVFIISSGETTPFSVEFLIDDVEPLELSIDMLGRKVADNVTR